MRGSDSNPAHLPELVKDVTWELQHRSGVALRQVSVDRAFFKRPSMRPTAISSITMSFMNARTWSHPGARPALGSNHRNFWRELFAEPLSAPISRSDQRPSAACSRFSISRTSPSRFGITCGWAANRAPRSRPGSVTCGGGVLSALPSCAGASRQKPSRR